MIDQLDLDTPKTKAFAAVLANLQLDRSALFIVDEISANMALASRNIPQVEVVNAAQVNTYQLLRYKQIVITQSAMEKLQARLSQEGGEA